MVRFSVPILPICLVGGVVKVSIEKCPTCRQIRSVLGKSELSSHFIPKHCLQGGT